MDGSAFHCMEETILLTLKINPLLNTLGNSGIVKPCSKSEHGFLQRGTKCWAWFYSLKNSEQQT